MSCYPTRLHINDLPKVILGRIVEYVTDVDTKLLFMAWKPLLNLLSINRLWRSIARPMVYKTLFFFEDEDVDDGSVSVYTNYSLIVENNVTALVKTMVFDSDCSVSFKPLLEYVLGLDHTGQVQWTNLNSVTVITRQKTTEDGIPTIYEPNDTVIFSVTGLAKMLTSRISKLQKLNLKFDNNAYMTSYISDKLIQKYQSSLIDASITNSIIVSPKTYMSNIVNLNLHYSRTAVPILPKINPVTIQSLSLIDIPLTFTWDDIIPEDIEGEVTFPNMHSLKIHIMDSHSSTDQTFVNSSIDKLEEPRVGTVNLPKLKNIHIQNYPIRLVYTTTLVMDKMTQVSIHNGVLGVDYTKGIRYNSVEKLSLKVVDSVDEECSSDLRAVKKMFSTKKATCSNELMVFHEKYQVDFTKYVLTNINTLMILQVDGHSYMMQLLKALPTLSKLVIVKLQDREITADTCKQITLNNSIETDIAPFHNKLEEFKIDSVCCSTLSKDEMQLYLHNVLLRFPVLQRISIDKEFGFDYNAFTSGYSARYPDLKAIEYVDYI